MNAEKWGRRTARSRYASGGAADRVRYDSAVEGLRSGLTNEKRMRTDFPDAETKSQMQATTATSISDAVPRREN